MTLVTCGSCAHFEPDTVNPRAGVGRCRVNAWSRSLPDIMRGRPWPPYPNIDRYCSEWMRS